MEKNRKIKSAVSVFDVIFVLLGIATVSPVLHFWLADIKTEPWVITLGIIGVLCFAIALILTITLIFLVKNDNVVTEKVKKVKKVEKVKKTKKLLKKHEGLIILPTKADAELEDLDLSGLDEDFKKFPKRSEPCGLYKQNKHCESCRALLFPNEVSYNEQPVYEEPTLQEQPVYEEPVYKEPIIEEELPVEENSNEAEIIEAEETYEDLEIVGDDHHIFTEEEISKSIAVLMTIKDDISEKLFTGKHNVLFVKRPPVKLFSKVYIADRKAQAVIGEASLKMYERGLKKSIWNKYGRRSSISKHQFDEYYSTSIVACALVVKSISKYHRSKPLERFGIKKVPTTFVYTDNIDN